MKWIATIKSPQPRSFVIEPEILENVRSGQDETWFYLYVYEGSRLTHDYLQQNFLAAKQLAFEQFQVPIDSWQFQNSS